MRALALSTVVLVLAFQVHAKAGQFCTLNGPTLRSEAGHNRLVTSLTCVGSVDKNELPYPDGELFVGATLFRASENYKATPLRYDSWKAPMEWAATDGREPVDLEAVVTHAAPGKTEIAFLIPSGRAFTHVQLAVWDKKNACAGDTGCPKSGYTLGRSDEDGLPIPIDTWPRPVCNKTKLIESGYLTNEGPGDPAGVALTSGDTAAFDLNDCYRLVSGAGLGYSLRRWRVGPLPAIPP
jgi:hypothetical protein